MKLCYLAVVSIMLSTYSGLLMAQITPSHVYQQTEILVAEITLIRDALNINAVAKDPGLQFNKKPLHVLTKSIELQKKIATAQGKNGISEIELSTIPLRKITPSDVLDSTEASVVELRKLKTELGINTEINEIPLLTGKTPSHVYENMWRASYLMDAISGAISPDDVFRNTKVILSDLIYISEKLGAKIKNKEADYLGGMTPKDANIEGYMNLHRLYRLQRKLMMPPVSVSDFPVGKISPSDVYDTTNTILGELARIKVKLGLSKPSESMTDVDGKTPSDVYKEMRTIGALIEALTSAT